VKPTYIGPRFVAFNDSTSWPRVGTDVEWQARYGDVDKLTLASFVHAFEALVWLPEKRRNEVIRQLRATAATENEAQPAAATPADQAKGGGGG